MNQKADTIHQDVDPEETQEWLESLQAVIEREGPERAHFLLEHLVDYTRRSGGHLPYDATTAYINTIPAQLGARHPGNTELEYRIRSIIRWNAMATVVRASKRGGELGGHIASFASAATLYDIGFNHFFRGPDHEGGGDLIYIQGHSSPGIYARSFLEGRISEEQLDRFREESEPGGLSSYPHPWLMPDYWQLPTVSMGLGPIMAIYQARFLKYLHNRGITDTSDRKVWCFLGDGETDEPESLGDKNGLLRKRMEEAVDGEYQNYKAKGGAYTREHFFGKYPELREMVANMTDEDIWRLNRGGHDPHKLYSAYSAASSHDGQPTVILAKTVKGYGMGTSGEAQNITHQLKKMDLDSIRHFRDRFGVTIADEDLDSVPYYHPGPDSEEVKYLLERREELGGSLPQRRPNGGAMEMPGLETFESLLKSTGDREISTTMSFVRALALLLRDKRLAERITPIVADEARTFGMEGMFRQLGIYSSVGQLYTPVDSDQLMFYKEDKKGQILQEGITEAGAMSSWIAAATSYANNGVAMIPFFIFYSMFGFQRVGDLAWAAGDMRAKGFLIGGTAGRTTLNGEGLQHEDGNSHMMSGMVPNCVSYDPTFGYELAVIIQDGLRRMYAEQEDIYYYITVMNENYTHPDMPEGAEEGIRKGMYLFRQGQDGTRKVQLIGSGAILREVIAASNILEQDFGVLSDIWSATSFTELRRDGVDCARWNRLNPEKEIRIPWVTACLRERPGPVVAASDYVRGFADQIRGFLPESDYIVLGTDGFGRSDTREKLRRFFEVDRYSVAYAALYALFRQGVYSQGDLLSAREKLGINPDQANPLKV
jgi:pyruvate dehydrogenase E1 component